MFRVVLTGVVMVFIAGCGTPTDESLPEPENKIEQVVEVASADDALLEEPDEAAATERGGEGSDHGERDPSAPGARRLQGAMSP